MAATTLSVIGLVSSLFAAINIPTASFLPAAHSSKTRVRVYAGLSSDGLKTTSGNIPGVAIWASSGKFIGKVMGVYNYVIDDGKYYEHEIKGPKLSTEYVSISAFGKDALCVAAVSVTSPTGQQGAWLGDVGMKCGAPWYPSNLVIPGSSPELRPACVWIDQDGAADGHPNKGITLHLPSFSGVKDGLAQEYNNDTATMCKSLPRFSMWTSRSVHMTLPIFSPAIEFNEDGSDKDLPFVLSPSMMESETTAPQDPTGTKLGVADGASAMLAGPITQVGPSARKIKRGIAQPLHDQLIVSNVTSHSARQLCESQTSAGPDFVSLVEGLFCDMVEKTLWPVCASGQSQGSCFDLNEKTIRHLTPELRLRELGRSTYRNVQTWS